MYAILVLQFQEFIGKPLHFFTNKMRDIRIACKVVTRYEFDNSHDRIEYLGDLFAYSIDVSQAVPGSATWNINTQRYGQCGYNEHWYNIHLWDQRGITSIGKAIGFKAKYNDTIPKDVYTEIEKRLSLFHRGFNSCSDCGNMIEKPAGRYFAGVYCDACWSGITGMYALKGGWKAVEAKETYE